MPHHNKKCGIFDINKNRMHRFVFDKTEHLKKQNAIDTLFATGKRFTVHPFRVVYIINQRHTDNAPAAQVMVIARKKLFKHAVSRNRYKRLLREAYRLHKQPLTDTLQAHNKTMRIAFLATSDTLPDFYIVERQMMAAIDRLTKTVR